MRDAGGVSSYPSSSSPLSHVIGSTHPQLLGLGKRHIFYIQVTQLHFQAHIDTKRIPWPLVIKDSTCLLRRDASLVIGLSATESQPTQKG